MEHTVFSNLLAFTPQQGIMILIGLTLIYLAVRRGMEPALLLPMGFGAILVNLPLSEAPALQISKTGENLLLSLPVRSIRHGCPAHRSWSPP